ncbi:MAG: DUF559 domain-containing protein [Anaerolineae bacterium]|nr:DUF559 domain-containing protein [Anaerolineae bacterium]
MQWRRSNGYTAFKEPILEDLQGNIVCKDAILAYSPSPSPFPDSQRRGTESPSLPAQFNSENESLPLRSGGRFRGGKLAQTRTTSQIWEKLKPFAREIRKDPTPAEAKLWQRLRKKQIHNFKFRRQHPVGNFITDFFCAAAKLVIEVDGSIHEQQQEYDAWRQAYIESLGLRVLRFSNGEVLQQIEAVLARIGEVLLPTPSLSPKHQGGGQRAVEPDWPAVDVIIGNPPFLGAKKMRGELGDKYVDDLRSLYEGRLPAFTDLVAYWFESARVQIERGKAKRVGLLATNSIGMGTNLQVLQNIKKTGDIFMAWSDRDWVLEGAAVRVAMIGFDNGTEQEKVLDGESATKINADLTKDVDLTIAKPLFENTNIGFIGVQKSGPFDITFNQAIEMLKHQNPLGIDNSKVVKSLANGSDLVRNSSNRYIIDFGVDMSEEEARKYIMPFEYVKKNVIPKRTAKQFYTTHP